MTDVTVKQFAAFVGIPINRLLEQFAEAGIMVADADGTVTEKQKVDLLAHLRKTHGSQLGQATAEPKRITLKRKTHSEIKMAGSMAGQVKTVSVEVRKKRTYVKRSLVEDETPRASEPQVPVIEPMPVTRITAEVLEDRQPAEMAEATKPERDPSPVDHVSAPEETEAEVRGHEELGAEAHRHEENEAEARRREEAEAETRRREEAEARRRAEQDSRRKVMERPVPARVPETISASASGLGPTVSGHDVKRRSDASEAGSAAARAKRPPGSAPDTKVGKKRPEPSARPAVKARTDGAVVDLFPRRDDAPQDDRFPAPRRGDLQQVLDKADRRKPKKGKGGKPSLPMTASRHGFAKPTAPVMREVIIPETISVADLAQKMSVKATEVIKVFLKMGLMVTINQVIDQDTAALAVSEIDRKSVV